MENYELKKAVKRLTLSQANEAAFAEIDEICEKGEDKDYKAKFEEEQKLIPTRE